MSEREQERAGERETKYVAQSNTSKQALFCAVNLQHQKVFSPSVQVGAGIELKLIRVLVVHDEPSTAEYLM